MAPFGGKAFARAMWRASRVNAELVSLGRPCMLVGSDHEIEQWDREHPGVADHVRAVEDLRAAQEGFE